ncbi:MAG: thioredoxin domain-containing protein [Candidatus Yanofskybacteria bacterium]|nr:thioredoxin domain-containing protein [Candidatus Yanofskybacteria bacterium]
MPVESNGTKFSVSVSVAVLIAAAMISGSILYVGGGEGAALFPAAGKATPAPERSVDPTALIGTDDPVIGASNAPVTIVEFSDFQCPFCRSFFTETYSKIKKDYIDTGKARLVFRDYPLPFHDAARPAALAAQCADAQGKFWQYHDALFQEQAKKGQGTVAFGAAELKSWAAQIGLNTTAFATCLDKETYAKRISEDMDDASTLGITGTPSFFVNGELIVGAQPYSVFKSAIDKALAAR